MSEERRMASVMYEVAVAPYKKSAKEKDLQIARLERELLAVKGKLAVAEGFYSRFEQTAEHNKQQLAASQERERKLTEFFREGMNGAFEGTDWNGADIQNKAVELGLAHWDKFDPEQHSHLSGFGGGYGEDICIINEPFTQASAEPKPEAALVPRKVEYGYDEKGNIILPPGPPFDGNPVLVLTSNGWAQAWWHPSQRTETQSGTEHDGFEWVCLDDKFTAELDEVKSWMPLPEQTQASADAARYRFIKAFNYKDEENQDDVLSVELLSYLDGTLPWDGELPFREWMDKAIDATIAIAEGQDGIH